MYAHRPYSKMRLTPQTRSPHAARSGFSLVEVALAIAIVSVALVSILSLMSTGLGNYRQVMDTTICAQIAQRVLNDAQQADFRTLTDYTATQDKPAGFSFRAPTVLKPTLRYFDEQGLEVIPASGKDTLDADQKRRVIYWVNTRITPRERIPRKDNKASSTYFQKTGTVASPGKWDSDGGTMIRVTVEVACNPTGTELKFVTAENSATSNLFDLSKTKGVRVFTYSAVFGRNE